jgi:hypothetical protein
VSAWPCPWCHAPQRPECDASLGHARVGPGWNADGRRGRSHPRRQTAGRAALQLRARRSNGSEFPVEVSLSPLYDDEGLAVVASIRDASERARTSAQTRRIQAPLDAIADDSLSELLARSDSARRARVVVSSPGLFHAERCLCVRPLFLVDKGPQALRIAPLATEDGRPSRDDIFEKWSGHASTSWRQARDLRSPSGRTETDRTSERGPRR